MPEQCLSIKACYSNTSQVMSCFVNYDDGVFKYHLSDFKEDNNLRINIYIIDSQKWPIEKHQDIPTTIWQHRITFYIPKEISSKKALLYVSGGDSNDKNGNKKFKDSKESLDFYRLSLDNKIPVIVLQDIPNQYLLIESSAKKEDQIIAYTYKKVIEDPINNAYLAGHLPMVKSIIKAMDAASMIFDENHIDITSFILVGASKRGWAAWLASLEDSRVSALVAIVVDILNVEQNIKHICNSYKFGCPIVLKDYKASGLLNNLGTDEVKYLMDIEDPYSYLKLPNYFKQASIPKYLINAAGDDFYAPDSSKFYFPDLLGNNYIRYLPKAMHYFSGNIISDFLGNKDKVSSALSNYIYFHNNEVTLPEISWAFSEDRILINSSFIPTKVKLWTVYNSNERDFKFLSSYSNFHLLTKSFIIWFSKIFSISVDLCDNCYQEKPAIYNCLEQDICNIDIELPNLSDGWRASFAELHYNIDEREFIVTTEINIYPNTYPEYEI